VVACQNLGVTDSSDHKKKERSGCQKTGQGVVPTGRLLDKKRKARPGCSCVTGGSELEKKKRKKNVYTPVRITTSGKSRHNFPVPRKKEDCHFFPRGMGTFKVPAAM